MQYEIGIFRTTYQSDTVCVDADNEDAAHEKALAQAKKLTFGEGNVEYEAETFNGPSEDTGTSLHTVQASTEAQRTLDVGVGETNQTRKGGCLCGHGIGKRKKQKSQKTRETALAAVPKSGHMEPCRLAPNAAGAETI